MDEQQRVEFETAKTTIKRAVFDLRESLVRVLGALLAIVLLGCLAALVVAFTVAAVRLVL